LKPFIIAEVGVNHDGELQKAYKLVDAAKSVGANAVKFQSFSADRLSGKIAPKVQYQLDRDGTRSHFEMLKALELSFDDQARVFDYCNRAGIEFFSTPYSIEDAEFLNELGVRRFKTASADLVDIPLHQAILRFKKQTIVSTGMASQSEIGFVANLYHAAKVEFVLMQATSEYPAKLENSNLAKIRFLKRLNPSYVGYSDHTDSSTCAQMSVALGCTYFEKHLTITKSDPGPDHAASLNPPEFKKYVEDIESAFAIMGLENPELSSEEVNMYQTSRKSFHFRRSLRAGHVLEEKDLILMRPGLGLNYLELSNIIGRTLMVSVEAGEILDRRCI